MTRAGTCIQTRSGVLFYPLDPRPEDIKIKDIAHALGMLCRFTGHCKKFYSIAQHAVLVSKLCPPRHALWGLLHDASEAYICDIARPVKQLPELETYRVLEKQLQQAIATRFGLETEEPAEVREADTLALGLEARDLMSPLTDPQAWTWATDKIGACDMRITETWDPFEAKRQFLKRFWELQVEETNRTSELSF